MNTDRLESGRKALIDGLLLKLPGVSARKIGGLDAYFVSDTMFACISGGGVGLRLPVATATEPQFSRANVVPFEPGGMASTREWKQVDRARMWLSTSRTSSCFRPRWNSSKLPGAASLAVRRLDSR
ncbi:MAG: hypothetical protein ACLPXB_04110 [Thiobacillaceae bacterium]